MSGGRLKERFFSSRMQWGWQRRRVWFTALVVAVGVLGLRSLGTLQAMELAAFDQLFRWRSPEAVDPRITLITIDDEDIQTVGAWPIPDQTMAEILEKIRSHQPHVIGLDIYRDLPVGSGAAELKQVFLQTENLIGIEKLEDSQSVGVRPPLVLAQQNRVGFNNVVVDGDNQVRRALLFWRVNGELRQSFALQLALMYLKPLDITPQQAPGQPGNLKLGQAVFPKLQPNDGGYVWVDDAGYQILSNLRHPAQQFQRISLTQLLEDQFDPELLQDRIVLVGSTAASLKDFFYTAYSENRSGSLQPIAGVELQAQWTSQIVSAALNGRSPLHSLPESLEWGWILVWSTAGAAIAWRVRRPIHAVLYMIAAGSVLCGTCLLTFWAGWWIPSVPPLMTLVGSAIAITGYIAYQEEELKKSKEFLSSVINTIPDPVFVKDDRHRWVVLNDAYCRLMGQERSQLLERSEVDLLPIKQAQCFRHQDDFTFRHGVENETENELTTQDGRTYLIATKRSLHKDAAGNQFLVGVLRDITHHKEREEVLRRTTIELLNSNKVLKQQGDQLRQMAYHDSLTGLPNRQQFHEQLSRSVLWVGDRDQMAAVLFLDLDGFKRINDTYGHDMGNLLLKAVAQRLSHCLRGSDTVARLGGDEFVILLTGIPSLQDVVRVAEKILETVTQPFTLAAEQMTVSTSIGISIYPLDALDPEELLKKADLAMYEAKHRGKNRYEFAQKIEI